MDVDSVTTVAAQAVAAVNDSETVLHNLETGTSYRLDQIGTQKGEVDEAPDIATGDAVALGQFPQRSRASGGKLFEPRSSTRDRLDQRGVTSGAVVLLWESRQHQPHFDTAAPEGHGRCKLDWAVAGVFR